MILTSKLTMDILKKEALPRVDMVQGDKNSRALEITLLADSTPWPVPEGVQTRLNVILPDGSGKLYDQLEDGTAACTVTGNLVTAYLMPEVLSQAGPVMLSVSMKLGECLLSTFPVMVDVQPGIPETLLSQA